MMETKQLDKLIASARLSGRLDALAEMRAWLEAETEDARLEHEELREIVEEGGNQ